MARSRRTIVEKIWAGHLVDQAGADAGRGDLLEVDRVLLHERQLGIVDRVGLGGTPIALRGGVVAWVDQQLPTTPRGDVSLEQAEGSWRGAMSAQVLATLDRLEATSERLDIPVFGPGDPRGGVLNVVGPEQGMIHPGALVVGTDEHMATLGAFGALALPIDDGELAEVVRSGVVGRERPAVVRVAVVGGRSEVNAKDLALWMLRRLGPGAAAGAVIELTGPAIRSLPMDGRMTLCNLAAESGAVTALVEPDRATFADLHGRPFAPPAISWAETIGRWSQVRSDPGAAVDAEVLLHAADIRAHTTWGVHAWQSAALDGVVPAPDLRDPVRRRLDEEALHDQGLQPGTPFCQIGVDHVFVGSCANARLSDLRAAADVLRGQRVTVPTWVVPGSETVAREAEREGLHRVLRDAGAEWRAPGCSLCIGANGDATRPGARLASTANRPRRGMVGPAARVHVMSPESAAAAALTGRLTDPRALG